ncbi:aminotransferase class I/II-fold pyridoxal phosphate-dependent enzyme [Desnuesiella massiliensis]|uniref:aminotransferase class I/II-fold pyridoxal phosphate-dependent enzyme n=1 Tax=Desnuesiella massiliensis TaxID=1650662 RepID=UPI0006E24F56|nr:aminotransferase class I/II-fold pyridoxal phosphate-dependent enzyme [Desnuesiella massiliensis]
MESAYLQLCSEGYITSKAGSGFIVENLESNIISKLKREDFEHIKKHKKTLPRANSEDNYKYDFQYGSLSASDFPLSLWKKISNKCLSALSPESMTSYNSSKGELELRIEIMKYLNRSRGVSCSPEQIIISSGIEHCLSLICQLFRHHFKEIALEDPGYMGARDIFINNGYNIVPIGLG